MTSKKEGITECLRQSIRKSFTGNERAHCWHHSGPESRKQREEGREIHSFEPDSRTTSDGSGFRVHFRKGGSTFSLCPRRGNFLVRGLRGVRWGGTRACVPRRQHKGRHQCWRTGCAASANFRIWIVGIRCWMVGLLIHWGIDLCGDICVIHSTSNSRPFRS